MRSNQRNDGANRGLVEAPISATLRVALYHRVSTVDQDVTLARTEIGNWAARQGGTVVLAIEETGSGARNDRPGLHHVLAAAQRGEVDCVAVWKLDRWGRSSLDVLANIATLTDAGVRFVAVSQGLDVKVRGDAMSKLMLNVLSAVAEFELTLIAERTRLGVEKARKAGVKLGRPRKAKAPTVEQIRKLRSEGMAWAWIAQEYGCTVGLVRSRVRDAK
jgi:putative DNA-invertase from lambdoid prophage Rac